MYICICTYVYIYIEITYIYIYILTGFKALSLYIGLYRFIFKKRKMNIHVFFLNIHLLVGLKQ